MKERFFLNLKMGLVWQRDCANHAEAASDIADYASAPACDCTPSWATWHPVPSSRNRQSHNLSGCAKKLDQDTHPSRSKGGLIFNSRDICLDNRRGSMLNRNVLKVRPARTVTRRVIVKLNVPPRPPLVACCSARNLNRTDLSSPRNTGRRTSRRFSERSRRRP